MCFSGAEKIDGRKKFSFLFFLTTTFHYASIDLCEIQMLFYVLFFFFFPCFGWLQRSVLLQTQEIEQIHVQFHFKKK